MASPLKRTKRVTRRLLPAFKVRALSTLQRAIRAKLAARKKRIAKYKVLKMGHPLTQAGIRSGRTPNPYTFRSNRTGRMVFLPRQVDFANRLQTLGFYKRAKALLPKARAYYQLKKMGQAAKLGILKPGTNISSFK